MTRTGLLLFTLGCVACGGTTAPPAGTDSGAPAPAADVTPAVEEPRSREVTVPAGTALRLTLRSAITSDGSQPEDAVRAELRQAVIVDGDTALPAGAEVIGVVTRAERAGRVKGRAGVSYRFDSLRVSGERYDIRTAALSHEAEATKGEDAKKIAIAAGAGAAVGALLGGGDGAAKGAAIGGAGGTGVVLATRGKEVRVESGTAVTARLTEPLTLRIREH